MSLLQCEDFEERRGKVTFSHDERDMNHEQRINAIQYRKKLRVFDNANAIQIGSDDII